MGVTLQAHRSIESLFWNLDVLEGYSDEGSVLSVENLSFVYEKTATDCVFDIKAWSIVLPIITCSPIFNIVVNL